MAQAENFLPLIAGSRVTVRVGCMGDKVALDPLSVLGFPCRFIPPMLHTYISFMKHRHYISLASQSVVKWNTPSVSLSPSLSHCNANRTVHIRLFTFSMPFLSVVQNEEDGMRQWALRYIIPIAELGSSFTTPDRKKKSF